MIYTVTFNPSIDCVYTLREFREGRVNRAVKESYYPGGKGLNVSAVLRGLSVPTTALGFLAGITGNAISDMLRELKCPCDFIFVKDGMSRINTKLYAEKESEINGIGPLPSDDDLSALKEKLQKLQKEDVLILSGSVPSSLSSSVYLSLIKALPHKEIKVVVDGCGELLLHSLNANPFLIKPNLDELSALFETSFQNTDEIIEAAKKLMLLGAENVLVSMAGDGSVLITKEQKIYVQHPPQGRVINSVGAGDSMIAGFIAGYLDKNDYVYALRMGTAAGAATAFSAHLADSEKIKKLLKQLPDTIEIV